MKRLALMAAMAVIARGDDQPAPPQFRAEVGIVNETSYAAGLSVPTAAVTNVTLVEPALSYKSGDFWRFSTSLVGMLNSGDETHAVLRVREAYFGVTAGGVDLLAGKHIVKWGTGYAFTPTGVLDPPRDPADPTDRLSVSQGREMVEADYIRGAHDVTVAWASAGLFDTHRPGMRETFAVRYNTLVSGFDTSVIVARNRGGPTLAGFNFTRVIGVAYEAHGEFTWRDGGTVLAGGKYTMHSGVGFIGEFYSRAGGPRRNYVFARAGKSRLRELPGWKEWDVSASLVANVSDGSHVGLLEVSRTIGLHCSGYVRAEMPQGKPLRSEYGAIPYSAALSFGFRVQL